MDADLRLQTLRKAFGIEDYKIAKENAMEVSKSIHEPGQGTRDGRWRPAGPVEQDPRGTDRYFEAKKKEAVAANGGHGERRRRLKASLEDEMETCRERDGA